MDPQYQTSSIISLLQAYAHLNFHVNSVYTYDTSKTIMFLERKQSNILGVAKS